MKLLYLRTKPILPIGESLLCLRPLRPLRPNRNIYYTEGFTVIISPLKKVNSRLLGLPGVQIGHLVQWSMAEAKEKRAPAQWDDTGITQVDDYAVVNPGPQTLYHGTACPVIELKAQREHFSGPPVVRLLGHRVLEQESSNLPGHSSRKLTGITLGCSGKKPSSITSEIRPVQRY